MRLNKKCRRALRDEQAGLVFRWRLLDGSWGRTSIAFLLAALLFLGATSVVQVKGKSVRIVSRETGRITILRPGDEGARALLDLARQHSPFPDRWEPDLDTALNRQMALLELHLTERLTYQPLLRLGSEPEPELTLPELFDVARPELPPRERVEARLAAQPPGEPRVITQVSGSLEARWRDLSAPLANLLGPSNPARPREFLGLDRRFRVAASPTGELLFCFSIDGVEHELDHVLRRWLLGCRLEPAPDPGDEQWGVVLVSVRSGAGPEKPKEKP